jgi:hypothetical protein
MDDHSGPYKYTFTDFATEEGDTPYRPPLMISPSAYRAWLVIILSCWLSFVASVWLAAFYHSVSFGGLALFWAILVFVMAMLPWARKRI